MSTKYILLSLLISLNLYVLYAQTDNTTNLTTTSSPTVSPTFGCSYTVISETDNRLARGVAAPLDTCLEAPFQGISWVYTCNPNKTEIIKQTYVNSISCNPDESTIINTTAFSNDFECDGDPCPSADYVDRSYVNTSNSTCIDGGATLGIGSYIINKCTYRDSDDISAFVTCDKHNIYYKRYLGSNNCSEIINSTNNATNLREITQRLGCNLRVNPPHKPNGYISNIICPGYNYDDSGSSEGLTTAEILGIVLGSIGGCCLLICLVIAMGWFVRRRKLTRRYTELND